MVIATVLVAATTILFMWRCEMNTIRNWVLVQVYLLFNTAFLCNHAGKRAQDVRVWCIDNLVSKDIDRMKRKAQ